MSGRGPGRRVVLRSVAGAGLVGATALAGCLDRERVDLRVDNDDDVTHRVRIVVVPDGGQRFTADVQIRAGGAFEREDVLPPAGEGRPYDTTVEIEGGGRARRAVGADGMTAIRVTVREAGEVRVTADTS